MHCSRRTLARSVAIRVWLGGGQLYEGRPGLALVTGRMLVEGTSRRSWSRIAADAEALGMDIVAFGGPEVIGLAIDAMATDWPRALAWAAELTLESSFPSERCAWTARQAAAELASLAEQPETVSGWAFLEQLYSAHPWGRPLQGSVESLSELTRGEVVAFHRESLQRRLIVSLAGDVDPREAGAEAQRLFSSPSSASPASADVVTAAKTVESVRRLDVPNSDQAHLYLGQLTVPVAHPDRVALEIVAVTLGAGPGLAGRVPERVREAEGLAYVTHVSTAAGAGKAPGRLVIYFGTAVENVDRVRRSALEELERLVGEGITEDELTTARDYLLGSAPFRRETARQVAVLQAQACMYGLPFDREDWLTEQLLAVDLDRANEVIRRHIDPSRLATTIGMPRGTAS